MAKEIKIALAGNPNCGKTTLFNILTGSSQYVGNWPGVTVEKKDGALKKHEGVVIQDLPGIYSLSAYSLEEVVARSYLADQHPDAILNIVDGTNIERNLYLTTQLVELGIPTVVAINMMDVVRKQGDKIDTVRLAKELGCPVVEISALKGDGCMEAAEAAIAAAAKNEHMRLPHVFRGSVEHALAHIEESIEGKVSSDHLRWYAVKLFERDPKIREALKLDPALIAHLEEHIVDCEKEMDDDAESIITNERYAYVQNVVAASVVKKNGGARLSISDRIDRFVTNRILAFPIFFVALCAMYWLAVSGDGPGTKLTDWANDGLFGDGWYVPFTTHVSEKAGSAYEGMDADEAADLYAPHEKNVEVWEAAYVEEYNAVGATLKKNFEPIESIDDLPVIDSDLAAEVKPEVWLEDEETGEILEDEETGEPRMWICDYEMYKASKEFEEPDPSDFGVYVLGLQAWVGGLLDRWGVDGLAAALVNDGVLNGVCTVLGFVPVIAIVFLFLGFLEDCGYMARVAFIMDRVFRKFGLSGKSFIPMLVGKGCGVPAVMATRTIESKRDQRMTIILCTFMPCGAKTVIITFFTAAFFRDYWFVAALMDIMGIAIMALGGMALKKSRAFAGDASPFVMELPAYHMPTFMGVGRRTWERVCAYAFKAGVVIFPCCVVLTFLMTFDWTFNVVDDISASMIHDIGSWIAWIFAPLGFGTWQGAAATVSAEIAKEEAIATLGMVAQGDASTVNNVIAMFKSFSQDGAFYKAAAMSFMLFNLFVPPCVVAIVATFREMGQAKWGWFALAFQLFVGYTLALNAYQFGCLFLGGAFGVWHVITILVDLFVLWSVFFRRAPRAKA